MFTTPVMAPKPGLPYRSCPDLFASLSAFGTGCNFVSLGLASNLTTALVLSEICGD